MLVSTESSAGATPVIPLPNPGEGGPVDSGGGVPVIPLPNPGEGGPVSPGSGQTPCYYCAGSPTGLVRFLNAADGYVPFQIFVNNWRVVRQLGYASLTPYGYVTEGFQTVSVVGQDGYVYLQKPVPFRANDTATIAVINTAGGLDLLQIADATCTRPYGMSCLRMANLAWDSDPRTIPPRAFRTSTRSSAPCACRCATSSSLSPPTSRPIPQPPSSCCTAAALTMTTTSRRSLSPTHSPDKAKKRGPHGPPPIFRALCARRESARPARARAPHCPRPSARSTRAPQATRTDTAWP